MAQRAIYLICFPDKPDVYSTSTKEAAVKYATKRTPNGSILFIFYNVDAQKIEVRQQEITEEEKEQ